jgi:hypothetical protein
MGEMSIMYAYLLDHIYGESLHQFRKDRIFLERIAPD